VFPQPVNQSLARFEQLERVENTFVFISGLGWRTSVNLNWKNVGKQLVDGSVW